jgi:hypothetical protein
MKLAYLAPARRGSSHRHARRMRQRDASPGVIVGGIGTRQESVRHHWLARRVAVRSQ